MTTLLRKALAALLVAGAALSLAGCDEFTLEVRVGLSVEPGTLEIRIGGERRVTARVTTTNVEDEVALAWRSRDPGVAVVDPAGEREAIVIGRTAGSTAVVATATAPGAPTATDTVEVTVTE